MQIVRKLKSCDNTLIPFATAMHQFTGYTTSRAGTQLCAHITLKVQQRQQRASC